MGSLIYQKLCQECKLKRTGKNKTICFENLNSQIGQKGSPLGISGMYSSVQNESSTLKSLGEKKLQAKRKDAKGE